MSDLSQQSVLSEEDYKDIASEQADELVKELAETAEPTELSEDEIAAQKAVDDAFRNVKKTLKGRSKSELIQILFNQGMQLRQTQAIATQLYEHNKQLLEELEKNEKTDSN
jgi:exopolyphosphatase/pppGpp-phosphohydrolase